MKLLHIAASPKPKAQSCGKRVADAFVNAYLQEHPQAQCGYIDLNDLQIPPMTRDLLEAFEGGVPKGETEARALDRYNALCEEFMTADRYVVSFPNWNLTAPPVLVSYMLAAARAGKAFRYTAHGVQGLLRDKKAAIVVSSGGIISENRPKEMCTAVTWLQNLFLLCGVSDVQVLYCEGMEQMPQKAEEIVAAAIENAGRQGAVWDEKTGEA